MANLQSCTAATCATLATPSNGGVGTCTNIKTTGQTCSITCNNEYELTGGSTQTCTGTGVGTSAWPNSQSCVAVTSSVSVTASQSATHTSSVSVTASQSSTSSVSMTASQSATSSVSVTASQSATSSVSVTASKSATSSVSVTGSQSATSSVSMTASKSATSSVSVTASQSAISSVSVTASQSATRSVSVTASATSSVSVTASQSATSSQSVSVTAFKSATSSVSVTASVTASKSVTSLMGVTASQTATSSVSVTASESTTSSAGTLGGSFSKPSSSKASRALNISLSVVFTVIPALAIIFCVYKRKLITRNWRPSSPEKQQRAESSTSHKPNHRFWRLQHEPSHPTVEAVHARAQSPTSPSHRRPFRFWQSKQKLPTPMLEKACDVVLQLPVPAKETNESVPPPSEIKKQLAQQQLDEAQKGDDVGPLEAAISEEKKLLSDVASAQQHLDELKVHRDASKSTSAAAVTATPGNSTSSSVGLLAGLKYHVFLTHSWDQKDELGRNNHESVSRVNEELKKRGLLTWFDGDRMQGQILDQMTNGIDESYCVAVFITSNYMEKVRGKNKNDNCKIEFNYARNQKGPGRMISIPMEPRCLNPSSWPGAVGAVLGPRLYRSNFAFPLSDSQKLQENIDNLVAEITRLISSPN